MVKIPRRDPLELKEELVPDDVVVSSSEKLNIRDVASNDSNKSLEDENSPGELSDCSSEER